MSATALRRLAKDFQALQTDPLVGANAEPSTHDMTLWHGNIRIPLCARDNTDLSCTMHFIMHFQPDYPRSAPHVGFCTPFPYHQGASSTCSLGPLAGLQEICLNILGNFDKFHTEWAKTQGEGWSSGMTVASVLVQLQMTMLDLNLTEGEKRTLKKQCDSYRVDIDDATVHLGTAPWPQVAVVLVEKKKDNTIDASKDLRSCYYTLNTAQDDILGFGAHIERQMMKTEGEIISWEAYDTHKVRLTAYKKKFTYFIPCYISPSHGDTLRWREVLATCLQPIMSETGDSDVSTVFARSMNSMTVELMQGAKACAVSFFEAYCSFWRSLRAMVMRDMELYEHLTERLQKFAQKEEMRHKDKCPDIGIMLALYTVMPETVPRAQFVEAYIDESMLRRVFWWRKDNVALNGAATFDNSKVSRELFLFNLRVLDIIVPNADATSAASAMDASFGCVPDRLERLLQDTKSAANQISDWGAFFEHAGASEDMIAKVQQSADAYVEMTVARAEQRGERYTFIYKGKGKGKGGGYKGGNFPKGSGEGKKGGSFPKGKGAEKKGGYFPKGKGEGKKGGY
eukprot:GEMP01028924.1.p1 GENE.GEMP01028924.1~~GEMP01028924.1.p1  ORF type:complete len:577 (+),score=168.02 GEMP01028924.1:28-1731(+)